MRAAAQQMPENYAWLEHQNSIRKTPAETSVGASGDRRHHGASSNHAHTQQASAEHSRTADDHPGDGTNHSSASSSHPLAPRSMLRNRETDRISRIMAARD